VEWCIKKAKTVVPKIFENLSKLNQTTGYNPFVEIIIIDPTYIIIIVRYLNRETSVWTIAILATSLKDSEIEIV
jgi:hypothetical protein